MTKIQLDLTEEQDRKLEIYKALNNLDSKAKAVAKLIDDLKLGIKMNKAEQNK